MSEMVSGLSDIRLLKSGIRLPILYLCIVGEFLILENIIKPIFKFLLIFCLLLSYFILH